MGCEYWGSFREWGPPWYTCKRVFWAYKWFVVGVVVAFLGFSLPWSPFYRVFVVFEGVRCHVLYIVESRATTELVSEDRRRVSRRLRRVWVGCGFFQGSY